MWNSVESLKGDHAIEFATAVIDPICEIAADEPAAELFYPKPGMNTEKLEHMLRRSIPQLLKNHRSALIAIIAANNGTEPADYIAQTNVVQMSNDIRDMIYDRAMRDFFGFAQPRWEPSVSAVQNTEA